MSKDYKYNKPMQLAHFMVGVKKDLKRRIEEVLFRITWDDEEADIDLEAKYPNHTDFAIKSGKSSIFANGKHKF